MTDCDIADWQRLACAASSTVGTPCFLMSERRIGDGVTRLQELVSSVKVKHWLSLKTQPVPRLVERAKEWGLGVEVTSEFELYAAASCGISSSRILVNGVGKHHWLPRNSLANIAVHFDSLAEVRALKKCARELNWSVGLRCAVSGEVTGFGRGPATASDQFGMTGEEVTVAAALLADGGVSVRGLHFHLHTNVERVSDYRLAVDRVADTAAVSDLQPEYVDVGGGLPILGESLIDGRGTASAFDFNAFRDLLESMPSLFPTIGEVWLENGRFLTGAAGALVVTVLDRKERAESAYLICDGGRTNHARLAGVESHEIVLEPAREGPRRRTIVCGPTCSAVDRLGCWMLPESVGPGDRIIWLTAGAYHIPLETRFSFGLAPLVWFNEEDELEVVRERETPAQWWNRWTSLRRTTDARCR